MKKDRQIYVHGEGLKEAKFIEIGPETTVSEIIKEFESLAGVTSSPGSPVECFLEDKEEPAQRSATAESLRIEKRTHVHCHRCRKVAVSVNYNGMVEAMSLPPQTKGEKVFKLSIKAFNIPNADASNLVLRIDNGQGEILQDDDHVGSLVTHPACALTLFLTPKKQVQG